MWWTINALEWAWDQGWYGDGKESCMSAAINGHLHVLQWLREDGAAWDGHVISCVLRTMGTIIL
jgi:hypothetical protein